MKKFATLSLVMAFVVFSFSNSAMARAASEGNSQLPISGEYSDVGAPSVSMMGGDDVTSADLSIPGIEGHKAYSCDCGG